MARKLKLVRCPTCGEVGRIKRNRIAKTFSYPQKIVSVPNISQLDTISDAWDYAAKVCLRMSQQALRKPPLDTESDNRISGAVYEHFKTVMPHSDEDIRRFESIHCEIIEERLVNYASNPNAVVTKMSLSLLYGSIVCTVMSDTFNCPPLNLKEIKKQRKVAYAIYTHFSELLMDERAKATWIGWLNLQLDEIGFGPTAAAKKHAKEIRGGTLTRKQIRNKAWDTFRKAQDSIRYNIVFGFIFKELGQRIKSDHRMSAVTLSLFEKLQFGVYDQKRKYEYAWVVHAKTSSGISNNDDYFKEGRKTSLYSKKSKSRWCQISRQEPLPIVFVSDTNNNI